jgi:hypothetical protein
MPVDNSYRVVIDENTYELNTDDIIFIPPGELHQIYISFQRLQDNTAV